MLSFAVPIIAVSLIVLAMVWEFLTRNEVRPMSRFSLNMRRWDDPNNRDRLDATVPASLVGSSLTCGHSGYYRISKDPAQQSRVLGK